MDIRPATSRDVEAIREVARRSWETDYPDVLSRETIDEGVEEWYSSDSIERELADEDQLLTVVEDDGEVIAFSHAAWEQRKTAGAMESSGDVLRLYVRPDRRREGIGRELLEDTCERLFERDVGQIKAMVLADNEPGNDFYESQGFRQVESASTEIGGESYEEYVYVRGLDL